MEREARGPRRRAPPSSRRRTVMQYHQQPQDTARMLMTHAPVTAAADDNLLDAVERMASRNIRHLPVIDGDRHVVGVLSDRDVRTLVGNSKRPLRPDDAVVRVRSLRVGDAMTRSAFVVRQ